jgi:protein phosphatase
MDNPLSEGAGQEAEARIDEPTLFYVTRSEVGAVRERNQDTCVAFVSQAGGYDALPLFGLFIVADGMGGHLNGHLAGRTVSRSMADSIVQQVYLPLLREGRKALEQPLLDVMEEAAERANAALRQSGPGAEMGTTLTCALVLDQRLYLLHVGDSRAYLWHDDQLQLLTTDHSVAKALEEVGQLTAEEAACHPDRNLLYRALMGNDVDVDAFTLPLPPAGQLLLCSDGLWGSVPQQEISQLLRENFALQDVVDRLVEKAMAAGGEDNITVVLVNFSF